VYIAAMPTMKISAPTIHVFVCIAAVCGQMNAEMKSQAPSTTFSARGHWFRWGPSIDYLLHADRVASAIPRVPRRLSSWAAGASASGVPRRAWEPVLRTGSQQIDFAVRTRR
jgi:hypothetical protein